MKTNFYTPPQSALAEQFPRADVVTWKQAWKFWWSFAWRMTLFGGIAGGTVGFVLGFLGNVGLVPSRSIQFYSSALSLLLSIPIGVWIMRGLVSRAWSDCHAAVRRPLKRAEC